MQTTITTLLILAFTATLIYGVYKVYNQILENRYTKSILDKYRYLCTFQPANFEEALNVNAEICEFIEELPESLAKYIESDLVRRIEWNLNRLKL